MTRGKLTDEVKKISQEQLGYEINVRQLRLLPYIQDCMMNGEIMARIRMNNEERDILDAWIQEGFIISRHHGLPVISKKFYKAMCAILMVGYCSEFVV